VSERRREPQEVEDRRPGDHRTIRIRVRWPSFRTRRVVGRRSDLRLRAVEDVRDDAKATKLMPLMRHKRSQNPLVDEAMAVVDALMRISSRTDSEIGSPVARGW